MFKEIIHTFDVGDEKFSFRKPTVSDQVKIISRKQELITSKKLIPQILSFDEDDYLFTIAQLDTCLVHAPKNWYFEKKVVDENIGKETGDTVSVISVTDAQIDTDEFQEVREEVFKFLETFRGKKTSGPADTDREGEGAGE